MKHFKNLSEWHRFKGYQPPENPLLSAINCKQVCAAVGIEYTSDFYTIGFKKIKSGEIYYGKTKYDHDQGCLFFIKPRQVVEISNLGLEEEGFAIHFHEDILNGHHLFTEIKKYGYFDYEINEALHLSPREQKTMWDLFHKIKSEYKDNQDEFTKDILLTHIDSLLKYSQRFYRRQFINRMETTGKTTSRFNEILNTHFSKNQPLEKGLPTVNYIAEQLHVSPRYLSDMLKEETGKTAIEHIHIFLISEAKNLLKIEKQTVAEIAYALGFENPPYFFRLFKKEVGLTPNQFKRQYLN